MRRYKHTPARLIRIALSAVILVLFSAGFFFAGAFGDAVLDVLTRAQLFPSILNTIFAGAGWLAAGFVPVLLVTVLFGRVYCSGLCPLGTLQDLITALAGKRSFTYASPKRLLRYLTLLGFVAAAAAGSNILVNLLEPYALFGRITRDLITPLAVIISHGVSGALRPFGLYLAPVNFHIDAPTMAVTVALALLLVLFTARNGRIFCNTLCPVGTVLSIPARFSLFAVRIDPERCTSCGICESVCKARCTSNARKHVDTENCVSCFNCIHVCPFDALHYTTPHHRSPTTFPERLRATRRSFLARMGGLVSASTAYTILPISFMVRKRATGPEGRDNAPASPPGSQGIAAFTSRCVACHLCVSRCPTRVLQPSLFEYGISGIMQPVMDYGRGYCEYECNICTQVCPTGAIRPLSLAQKQKIQIGTSHFIEDRCVVFTDGTACGACAEVCPTQACHMVPHENGLTKPVVENEICMGCGNCEYSCPVEGGKAIYVVGREEHILREVRKRAAPDRDGSEGETSESDEPEGEPWPF